MSKLFNVNTGMQVFEGTPKQCDAFMAAHPEHFTVAVATSGVVVVANKAAVMADEKPEGAKTKPSKASAAKKPAPKKPASASASKPSKRKGSSDAAVETKEGFKLVGCTVEATQYLPTTVYQWNKGNIEKFGGNGTEYRTGNKLFGVAFEDADNAKAFFEVASLTVPNKDFKKLKKEQASKAEKYKEQAAKKVKRPNKDIAAAMRECTGNRKLDCTGSNWEVAVAAYDKGGIDAVKAAKKQYKCK